MSSPNKGLLQLSKNWSNKGLFGERSVEIQGYFEALGRNFSYSSPFLQSFSSNFDQNKGLLKSPFLSFCNSGAIVSHFRVPYWEFSL